jgi:hypothetical protein
VKRPHANFRRSTVTKRSRFTLSLLAIAWTACTVLIAPARAADASCKPVVDATTNAAHTPYHETFTADGRTFEKIYTMTAMYVGSQGRWTKATVSPQDIIDNTRELGLTITDCKSVRTEMVDGQVATVYAAHVRLAADGGDSPTQFWIAHGNGLPLKSESDNTAAGHPMHVSARFTYDNVQPPAGAH